MFFLERRITNKELVLENNIFPCTADFLSTTSVEPPIGVLLPKMANNTEQ